MASDWHRDPEIALAAFYARNRAPNDILRRGLLRKGEAVGLRNAMRRLNHHKEQAQE